MITLNNPTIKFLQGEIDNEAEGGVSPATVASAIDSFLQCPDAFTDTEAAQLELAIGLLSLSQGNQAELLEDLVP